MAIVKTEVQLTPHQHKFALSDAPLIGFIGGRGAGKTYAGCYRLFRRCLPNRTYLALGPTYTMLRDVIWPKLVGLGRQLLFIRDISRSRLLLILGNGATIICRSADDPDKLRGLTLTGAWIDEASLVAREVVDVIRFTLRESPHTWLACTFTPKGKNHWTYEYFGRPQPGVDIIHCPSVDNPFLPPDFIELTKRHSSPLLLAQELDAEFVDLEGVEWPSQYWGEWVWVNAFPPRDRWSVSAIAVDPSMGKQDRQGDYSAIVVLVIADDLLWIDADLQLRPVDKLVRDVMVMCDRYKPDLVGFEANQFQELIVHEFMRVAGAQFTMRYPVFQIKNTVSKLVRIRRLSPYIVRRELRVLDSPGGRLLVQQLQEFPQGRHDDGPDALEMAVRLILETGGCKHDAQWSSSVFAS